MNSKENRIIYFYNKNIPLETISKLFEVSIHDILKIIYSDRMK